VHQWDRLISPAWAAPLAEVDLRAGGTIWTHDGPEAKIGDPGTNILHIVNYVPERVLTLQAELSDRWPDVMKADAGNLMNVIVFDVVSDAEKHIRSYGVGYRDCLRRIKPRMPSESEPYSIVCAERRPVLRLCYQDLELLDSVGLRVAEERKGGSSCSQPGEPASVARCPAIGSIAGHSSDATRGALQGARSLLARPS